MRYEVYSLSGKLLMTTDQEACWHDSETARAILDAGYVIKIDGKRVTKSALTRKFSANRTKAALATVV